MRTPKLDKHDQQLVTQIQEMGSMLPVNVALEQMTPSLHKCTSDAQVCVSLVKVGCHLACSVVTQLAQASI